MLGESLAHFRITDKLGEGGMGEVWRADDTRLGREVAIKVLPEVFTSHPERLARFEREARFEVYVTALPDGGRKWQVSTQGGSYPRWAASGRELFYVTESGTYMAAVIDGSSDTLRVGAVSELFSGPINKDAYDYDVTADGQHFLTIDPGKRPESPPLTLVTDWPSMRR